MKKNDISHLYTIQITETLIKQINIKAGNRKEALKKAKELYSNAEIMLTSENYSNTDIQIVDEYVKT